MTERELLSMNPPGWGNAREYFALLCRRLAGRGRLLARFENTLREWISLNFDRAGGLLEGTSRNWPPLAHSTLASRRAAGLGTRPLRATGRLRRGITFRRTPQRLVLDNPVAYAAPHQLGRGVPQRAFFPGAKQAERLLHPVAENFIRESLR
ncbi:MAG: phage virion morphogenesis protein [Deltaproteobacteria bacterium]|nr:phage virion morphogenesis protein [Deltaproteobacteria bacterium]